MGTGHTKLATVANGATRLNEQKVKRSLLKSITPGDRLRLRDDILRHVHPRELVFKRVMDDDTVLLVHESGGFGWSVRIDLKNTAQGKIEKTI